MQAPVIVAGIDRSRHLLGAVSVGERLQVVPHNPGARSESGEFTWWLDGTAIFRQQVLQSAEDVCHVASRYPGILAFVEDWGRLAKNPSCAIVADFVSERVLLLPDPLGGCLVFHLTTPTASFASSSLTALIKVAGEYGKAPSKNLQYQLERAALGNGGLVASSYTGVNSIGIFSFLDVDESGVRENRYAALESFLSPAMSYADALDDVRTDVLDSMRAISDIETETRIAHLTGGVDSRLVLGAILQLEQEDRFSFFTSGPTGTADRDVSDGLAVQLGLRRTHDAGLSIHPSPNLRESSLRPMSNSGGLTSSGPSGLERFQSNAVVGGGYGGVLRSTYSHLIPAYCHGETPVRELADKMWGREALAEGGLMTTDVRQRVLHDLAGAFTELSELGIEDDYLGDAFYLSYRNRYHFGQNSMLWNRFGARFDPLYSVSASRLARMLPLQARETNVAGFDLMNSFSGNLASYPFDKERFSSSYLKLRRRPAPLPLSTKSPDITSSPARYPSPPVKAISPEERQRHIKRSRTLGVNYWQIASLSETQADLRRLLANTDAQDLDSFLNVAYVRRLSREPLKRRPEIRHLYAVHTMLLWYFEG